jgi:hypothetical protein
MEYNISLTRLLYRKVVYVSSYNERKRHIAAAFTKK